MRIALFRAGSPRVPFASASRRALGFGTISSMLG
jgi:hypothetical protein